MATIVTRMRLAFTNAKGGTNPRGVGARGHGGVRLAPAARRITWAIRAFNRDGVTVAGFVEFSRVQAERIRDKHPRWKVHRSINVRRITARGSVELGNAVAWRDDVWRLVERGLELVRNVRTNYNPPVLDLLFPWVDLEHRETGQIVRVLVVHFPAGRSALMLAQKLRCAWAVVRFVLRSPYPVALAGDLNARRGMAAVAVLLRVLRRGVRSAVDVVMVAGGRARDRQTFRDFRNRVTDHPAGIAVTLVFRTVTAGRR